MEKWIPIIGLALTLAGVIWGASRLWQKMNSRMDAVEGELAGNDKKHAAHYQHIGDLESSISVLGQQMTDHNVRDDERFGRIDDYMKESRADIKEILRNVKR